MEPKNENVDADTSSDKVLDYYRKYSQNKNLPKYFSGTSVSYIPEIVPKEQDAPETSQADDKATEQCEVDEQDKNISRASSAMSMKKLEWDNGADIGYKNAQESVHRSHSLPDIKITDTDNSKELPNVQVVVINYDDENDSDVPIQINIESSSSDTTPQDSPKPSVQSSSTSQCGNKPSYNSSTTSSEPANLSKPNSERSTSSDQIKAFASDLSYLKGKIGLPDAHSTPVYPDEPKIQPEIKPTPARRDVTKKKPRKLSEHIGEEQQANPNPPPSDKTGVTKKVLEDRVVSLSITKPIVINCESKSSKIQHKKVQAVTKTFTTGIQTDSLSKQGKVILISSRSGSPKNQDVIELIQNSSDKTKSSNITDSEVIVSNCDSFEYLKANQKQYTQAVAQPHVDASVYMTPKISMPKENIVKDDNKLKRHETKPDLSNCKAETDSHRESLQECPLGKAISASIVDVNLQKNFDLLQRLVKSKKYDAATKRHYVKKIMNKIIELNCLDESGSTSSELFKPKKGAEQIVPPAPKLQSSTESSDPKVQRSSLQNNVPWFPAQPSKKLSPRKKHMEIRTFNQEIPPCSASSGKEKNSSSKDDSCSQPEIIPIHEQRKKHNRFTLTNNELYINHDSLIPENSQGESPSDVALKTPLSDSGEVDEGKLQSSSEKFYNNWREDKTTSEKLMEHRLRQSNGDYLNTFAKVERQNQLRWISNEICHLKKLKYLLEAPKDKTEKILPIKQTHVYSLQKANEPGKRKYVIETDFRSVGIADIDFELDGQVYSVENGNGGDSNGNRLRGNIEVTSDRSTTNIRVSTRCKVCKQKCCLCDKPRYKTKGCGSCSCVNCGKSPCVCIDLTGLKSPDEGVKWSATAQPPFGGSATAQPQFGGSPTAQPSSAISPSMQVIYGGSSQPRLRASSTMHPHFGGSGTVQPSSGGLPSTQVLLGESATAQPPFGGSSTAQPPFEGSATSQASLGKSVTAQPLYEGSATAQPPFGRSATTQPSFAGPSSSSKIRTSDQKNLDQDEMLCEMCGEFTTCVNCSCVNSEESVETDNGLGFASAAEGSSPASLDRIDRLVQASSDVSSKRTQTVPYRKYDDSRTEFTQTDGKIHAPSKVMCTQTSVRQSSTEWKKKLESKSEVKSVNNLLYPIDSYPEMLEANSDDRDVTANTGNDVSDTLKTSTSSACACCKRNIHERNFTNRRSSLSLCAQCFKYHPCGFMAGEEHRCRCFFAVKTEMLRQLEKTIDDMTWCKCRKPDSNDFSEHCNYCQKKLRKTTKTKNGIAYSVRLEDGTPPKENRDRSRSTVNARMQEIKIKADGSPASEKIVKDRVNKNRKDVEESDVATDDTNGSKTAYYTLQEYLQLNRPDFIDAADSRRQVLLNNRTEREKHTEEMKLRFLTENRIPIKKNRLFTAKEMKEITKRHYQKLPEVQNKLSNQRRQRLNLATRLITDTFNKKIQRNTLRGRRDFPLDVNIVNLL